MSNKILLLSILALSVIFPATASAVNFYDGARAPGGLYFLSYSSIYSADKATDFKGRTSKNDYGYTKLEELFRFCYYNKDLVLTALVPAADVHSRFYNVSSNGLGDINLGAGYFLPVKCVDILPMLFVKFPTGEYDSSRIVNYGTNQYDIKPTVFIYKAMGRFSIDGAAKYYIRRQNPSTKISPGDELYLQGLLGWKFSKNIKAGPSLNWMKSSSQVNDGANVPLSRRESLSLGGDIYLRFKPLSVTLTYLRDIRAKNTTKGDFFQVKTCYKF
jgi:hypothetical protein